ncbi:MAG TPA: hypothetical protein PLK34_02135, partial [Candidatus Pacearchaeota archaeon]|nr:hypothetical protein [Candidatus Pacearchaeota archaeon]
SDLEEIQDSTLFNLTVIENTAPEWNASKNYTFAFTVNSSRINNSLQAPIYVDLKNVSEEWIVDNQGNEITFSNVSTGMTYFNLTSEGIINFTPYKEDVGVHNVVIYATDSLGLTSTQTFVFNISNTNTEPFISQQNNLSVNETDTVSGVMAIYLFDDDLLINDETLKDSLIVSWIVLNRSDGQEVDLFTFNFFSSEANNSTYSATEFIPTREDIGNYTILVNVTDESNALDEMTFNLEIRQKYYPPSINFPAQDYVFNLTENNLSSLSFNATHFAGDNLTYTLYLNGTLRGNFSSYGNGQTNATWSFTPNFTDETHENLSVLQLIVSNPYENASRNFSVNISHANSPLNFTTNISDMEIQGYTKNMDLSDYFEDLDAFDIYHNQTVNFTIQSNASSSALSWNFTSWNVTISSGSSVAAEILNITAEDINLTDSSVLTTAESNNFEISFITPTPIVVTTPTSSGGSGGTRPETCVSDWNAEFSICVDGQRTIEYWDENGCAEDFTQTAPCDDPGTILQKLVFTEELITIEHPECIEALEAVKEAENLINNGDLEQASDKLDSVINWCREAITQSSDALFTKPQDEPQRGIIWWVAVIFSVSLFLEVIYYFIYREVRLRRIANTKI